MRRSNSLYCKGKSRSLNRSASLNLINYLSKKYADAIPVAAVTTAHKLYGKTKALEKDDRFINRFSDGKGNIDASKFLEYLSKPEPMERGKGLTESAVARVYQNFSNQDGKLSFEYLMKLGELCGTPITMAVAKGMVRKFGKRKDHLSM